MIPRSLFFITICATYLGLTSAAFAGAWTQNRGGYYFKVGASYLNSTIDIDANGKQIQKANMGELRDLNYSTKLSGIRPAGSAHTCIVHPLQTAAGYPHPKRSQ